MSAAPDPQDARIDSAYAWVRVFASLAIMAVGFSGLYSIVVALKPVAADLGASRGGVSLAYAVLFAGFGFGGIIMGWWSDRIGIMWPVLAGSIAIASGLLLAGQATALWQIVLAFGFLVGFLGMSAIMVPLVANITHWFDRRRGIATSVVISGSYLAGTMWPPLLQIGIDEIGWRETWTRVGIGCFLVMAPLSLLLRPQLNLRQPARGTECAAGGRSGSLPRPCSACCARRGLAAASRWRRRRPTWSRTQPTSGTPRRAARKCSRSCSSVDS